MYPDVLKHLGKVLRDLIAPIEEPIQCPRCRRPEALLPMDSPSTGKTPTWRCKFCNQIVSA